jgi:HicB family
VPIWCHDAAMDLGPYLQDIHRQLETAAEAGGEEARAVAERIAAPLEAAIRLCLQDVLAAAAEEITVELAPGSVELRMRGRDPEFVVTPPSTGPSAEELAEDEEVTQRGWRGPGESASSEGGEGTISRINLRLPEHLKARVEAAAGSEGLSVNAWLVRAASAAVERAGSARRRERRPHGAQRYTGWAR